MIFMGSGMKETSLKKQMILVTYIAFLLFSILRFDVIKSIPKQLFDILSPFFIGVILAFVLNKPMALFEKLFSKIIKKKEVCRGLSILLCYILLFAVVIGIFMFIVPQLITNIKLFIDSLGLYMKQLEKSVTDITEKYDLENLDLDAILNEVKDVIKQISTALLNYVGNLVPRLFTVTSNIVSILFKVVITLVVSINILAGKETLLRQAKRIVFVYLPLKWALKINKVALLANDIFGKYIVGQLTEACILGGLCFIGMNIFKFDYSILISTLIAITALVPVAGAWIGGGIASILLALVSPVKAILFLIYLMILQQLENNLIYPKVVGSSIGLPGLWVIFAVTVGGGIFGFAGIMLSVPVVSLIYTLVKEDVRKKSSSAGRKKL